MRSTLLWLSLVLTTASTAYGWPPGYNGPRDTTIYSANSVYRDGTPRMEHRLQGQALRKFQELEQRVGTDQARATFEGLHPFVQNTYGDKVPIIGVSQSPHGGATVAGGVVSDEHLSAAIKVGGPLAPGMNQMLDQNRKQVRIQQLERELAALKGGTSP
jgi:hypothetical protein